MDSLFRQTPPRAPAAFNMAAHVLAAAAGSPEKNALQILKLSGAERWSYGRLEAAVRGTGTGLLQAGLKPGDRLLMRLGNTVDFPLAYLGAIAVGVVPVPTSAQLTGTEITKMAAQVAPAAVVAAPGVALPEMAGLSVIDLAQLQSFRDLPPCDWDLGDPDRLAYLIFTSGTSGQPRAVMHAHRAIIARAMMYEGWYGLSENDRLLHAGAFNWTYTLGTGLMDPWVLGATALIPAEGITAAQLPLLLRRFDATIFAAAPGVYRQMLRAPLPALPRLRHGLSAGEKLPPEIRAAWEAASGTRVYEALGMSECSTFLSGSPARPAPEGASGYPQPGRQIAVLDADGAPVPRGTPGTLAVHRSDPGLFLGYWGQPDETAHKFAGEWFVTGDTVAMAEDDAVTYLGRDDDMLNAGGFRVSPLEVEEALNTHPGISESAAIEVEIAPGTRVIALIYSGTETHEAELAAFAATRLARYKQPRLYRHTAALPKGANNKLARRALRQTFALTPAGDI